jgi:hypothetical protein
LIIRLGPVHIDRAGRTSQVWPDLGGAAGLGRCGRSYPLLELPPGVPEQGPRILSVASFGLIPLRNLPRVLSRTHHQGWWVPTSWKGC